MTIHIAQCEFVSGLCGWIVAWPLKVSEQQPHVLKGCPESDLSFQGKRKPNSNVSPISPRRSTLMRTCSNSATRLSIELRTGHRATHPGS